MRQSFLVVVAGFAGFLDGILSSQMMRAREESHPRQVIRARSFELTNETGEVISYWGIDRGENIVLAFGGIWPDRPGGKRPLPGNPALGLKDPDNQLASIGVVGNFPILKFRGEDGKPRARLLISMYGKPSLLMDDETGARLLLGIEQSDTPGPDDNDWSLAFLPERARIGMYTERHGGKSYVRGSFAVHDDKVMYPYGQAK